MSQEPFRPKALPLILFLYSTHISFFSLKNIPQSPIEITYIFYSPMCVCCRNVNVWKIRKLRKKTLTISGLGAEIYRKKPRRFETSEVVFCTFENGKNPKWKMPKRYLVAKKRRNMGIACVINNMCVYGRFMCFLFRK